MASIKACQMRLGLARVAALLTLARLNGDGGHVSPAQVPPLRLTKGFCGASLLHKSYPCAVARAHEVHADDLQEGKQTPQ